MTYSRTFLIFALFIPFVGRALTTFNLCLEDRGKLRVAKSDLSSILLADEIVDVRRTVGCLEVSIRPYRKDLVEAYMRRRYHFRLAKITQNGQIKLEHSSVVLSESRMCRLKLEEVFKGAEKAVNVKVGRDTRANSKNKVSQGSIGCEIVLTSGMPGTLQVDGESLVVTCIVKTKTHYAVSFNLQNKIISSVSLIFGQRLNVGDIVKNSKNKDHGLSAGSLYNSKNSEQQKKSYFLSIAR